MYLKTILEVIIMRAGIVCMIIGFVSALGVRVIHDKLKELKEAKNEGAKITNAEDSTEQESSDTVQC